MTTSVCIVPTSPSTLDDERVGLLLDEGADGGRHVFDEVPDVDLLGEGVHPVRLDLRQVQDVIDQAEKMLGVGT